MTVRARVATKLPARLIGDGACDVFYENGVWRILVPGFTLADFPIFTITTEGLVPAPLVSHTNKFLATDGVWREPVGAGTPLVDDAVLPQHLRADTGAFQLEFRDRLNVVSRAGDTMTGMLILPPTIPTGGNHAANKTYVDAQVATSYHPNGTDVAIADGGTGASTAAQAWANIRQIATTTVEGAIEIADNAEVLAAASATLAVTPGAMRQHPGVVKAWVHAGPNGNIFANNNITSVTDGGTGLITANFSLGFVNASNMCLTATATGAQAYVHGGTLNAGSMPFGARNTLDALVDPISWWIMGVGTF